MLHALWHGRRSTFVCAVIGDTACTSQESEDSPTFRCDVARAIFVWVVAVVALVLLLQEEEDEGRRTWLLSNGRIAHT